MSNRVEWVHASERPEVVSPEVIEEMADSGNDAGDWGVGAEGVMVYGTLEQLHDWLTSAIEDLEEPLRKDRNAKIKALRTSMGDPKCDHSWVLTEDGYSRTWGTRINEEDKVLTAYFDGSSDFSDDGDGVYLMCETCGHVKPVPAKYEVDYQ